MCDLYFLLFSQDLDFGFCFVFYKRYLLSSISAPRSVATGKIYNCS